MRSTRSPDSNIICYKRAPEVNSEETNISFSMQTLVFGLGLTDSTLNWTHDFPRDVSEDLQYHSSSVTKSLSNHCKFVKTFPTRLYTTIQHLFKNKAFLALVSLKPMSVSCLRMVWNKKMHIL